MLSRVKQVTIVISGDVQLIGFRGYLEELATGYDLAGFVYNDLRDATVKFVCEGEASNIEELVKEIEKNPGIRVDIQDKILLPKPVGRVVIGIKEILLKIAEK
jgi:acylphosphatase